MLGRWSAFADALAQACPQIPYLALGFWLAWLFTAVSASGWTALGSIEGSVIAPLYSVIMVSLGASLVLSVRAWRWVERVALTPRGILVSSAVSALSGVAVILCSPFLAHPIVPEQVGRCVYVAGSCVGTVATVPLVLQSGRIYGALAPRRAIMRVSLAYLVFAFVFFIQAGVPVVRPFEGGPEASSMALFVLLPVLAGFCLLLSFVPSKDGRADSIPCDGGGRRAEVSLPASFRKLCVSVFLFALVMAAIRGISVLGSSPGATADHSHWTMVLLVFASIAFAFFAVAIETSHMSFGKLFSAIMVAAAAVISLMPFMGIPDVSWGQSTILVLHVFDFALWCVLSFVVRQRGASAVRVFGAGYGALQLGCGVGWALSAWLFFDWVSAGGGIALYSLLMVVVLVCTFVMFSEKEFDRLFEPSSPGGLSLDDLMRAPQVGSGSAASDEAGEGESGRDHSPPRRGQFCSLVESIADEHGLSPRERDVFRELAMGYSANAVAENLQLSPHTVRGHAANVYAKLGVHSRSELMRMVDSAKRHP